MLAGKLFLIALCALGVGLTLYGAVVIRAALRSATWPSVEGIVESSAVDSADRGDNGVWHGVNITYRFVVDGKARKGTLIAFGLSNFYGSAAFAWKYSQRYPVGKVVTVFHEPTREDASVLEPGLRFTSFLPLVAGAFLIFVCVVILSLISSLQS